MLSVLICFFCQLQPAFCLSLLLVSSSVMVYIQIMGRTGSCLGSGSSSLHGKSRRPKARRRIYCSE